MLQSNFAQQRVFIVGEGSLLDEGVTDLLTHNTNLLVSRAIYSDDPFVLDTIKRDQPDVILVCESVSRDTVHILDSFSSLSIAMEVLIVVVRLHKNVIDVYARPNFVEGKISCKPRQIMIKTGFELLNVVRRKHNVKR